MPSTSPFFLRESLLFAALLAAACSTGSPPETAEPPFENLVLITADTWRGDHFLSERGGLELTPNLARFAERATVFTDASSVGNETMPGLAGILTGLLPHRSAVVTNQHVLPPAVPTLATRLREAGFASAAFVGNFIIGAGVGFERGFDHYELVPRKRPLRKPRANQMTAYAARWLDARPPQKRFFLWLHYMDPHGPYQPPEEHVVQFDVDSFEAEDDIPLQPRGTQSGKGGIPFYQQAPREPSRDGRDYLMRYAAEVRFLDQEMGRFLEILESRGLLENTVVVITSDHGEALAGEHGYYFCHSAGLTQDQIHVPLVLYYPGVRQGAVVERPVSTLGVAPTVLALLGLPAPEGELDGIDLHSEQEIEVVSQGRHQFAIRLGDWKLRAKGRELELAHLERDPLESEDLTDLDPQKAQSLRRRFLQLRKRKPLTETVTRRSLSAEERQALKALGYL